MSVASLLIAQSVEWLSSGVSAVNTQHMLIDDQDTSDQDSRTLDQDEPN